MLATTREDQNTLPDDLDWESEISAVVTHNAGTSDAEDRIARQLPWADALYYDGNEFEDLITSGKTDTYHHRIFGMFLTALQISNPAVHDEHSLRAQGRLYAATESPRGDYHTDFSTVMVEATITIRPKDPRTAEVLRRHVLEHHSAPEAALAA